MRAVLDRQAREWNAGNLAGFTDTYWRSPRARFQSGGDVSIGWQTMYDCHRRRYTDRAVMGQLDFSKLQLTVLIADAARAFGRWRLQRARDTPLGPVHLAAAPDEKGVAHRPRSHLGRRALALRACAAAGCRSDLAHYMWRWIVDIMVRGAVVLAAVGASPALAASRAVRSEGGVPSVVLEKYALANGLQVVLARDDHLPQIAFELRVHVGAMDERPGVTGFAHLFEHLVLFGGTRHIPEGMAGKILDAAGATDGNGTTTFEGTNFFFTLPAHEIELGLWVQAERLGYMLDVLDRKALANQKDIVRNERRQRIENEPYGLAREALYKTMFLPPHPFHGALIGTHGDIQAATLDEVKAFSKAYYRPGNATLVLVGDFEPTQARKLVDRYFGSLSAGEPAPRAAVVQPRPTAEKRLVVTDQVQLPRLFIGWHTPAAYRPGDAAMTLAASILGEGPASRLYQRLVYQQQIAQQVSVEQWSHQPGSIFSIEVTARPGHTLAELEKAIDEELAGLAAKPPSQEEVTRARNLFETRAYGRLERLIDLAHRLARYNQLTGDPGFLAREQALMQAVTPEDVRQTVAAYLTRSSRVVVHAVPGKQDLGPPVPTPPPPDRSDGSEQESVNPPEPWRSRRPRPGAPRPVALPQGRSLVLPNGLTLIHAPSRGVPLVSAVLVVRAGTMANPEALPGLAAFTVAMLPEGTRRRGAGQLAADFARLGTSLDVNSGTDDARLSLTCRKASFPAALDILAEVVEEPAFAPVEVERQRQHRLARLLQRRQDPSATAEVISSAALFGPRHPLGQVARAEAALRKTTRDDLLAFWRAHYRPEQAALVVAGDLSFDEMKELAVSRLGGWKGEPASKAQLGTTVHGAPTAARLVLIDAPGAAQTALQAIAFAPRGTARDAAGFRVMNALLEERLGERLRRQKGYTYGVQPIFFPARDLGTVVIRGNVRTDVTGPAVADLLAEIRKVRDQPAPRAVLDRVRTIEVASLPSLLDTDGQLARRFATLWVQGLPLDHYARLPGQLARADSATARQLARKYLAPERIIVVAVGDRVAIATQLEALGLPTERWDADGNPVRSR
jgi:zinc protease